MALKDTWTNKIDNQDIVYAEDINSIAQAVINLENTGGQGSGITETVTQLSMTLPQISAGDFSSASVDYTPVYQNSIISLDIVSCHMKEGSDFYGMPVVFQVLPKYANLQIVEGVKSITAIRMGASTAKIDITLKVHEIKCS